MIFFLVPVYNEEATITNLFKELSDLTLSEEIFYVFSDDGSSDKSIEVIKNLNRFAMFASSL